MAKTFALQGWGGRIFKVQGGIMTPLSMTFDLATEATDSEFAVLGAFSQVTSDTDFQYRQFGGKNTYAPAAYFNHKPMVVYNGRIYQALNRINDAPSSNRHHLYITRFDGSGVFSQDLFGGDAWKSGPGNEILSPSGGDSSSIIGEVQTGDLCALEHNGNIFFVGQIRNSSINTGDWDDFGWDYIGETINYNAAIRRYGTVVIQPHDDKRIAPSVPNTASVASTESPATSLVRSYYGHGTDAISYKNDIYFANLQDIIRFPGGSGAPILKGNFSRSASTYKFESFPASGYVDGKPLGEDLLLVQDGSGVMYKIQQTRNYPSGMVAMNNFGEIASSVRLGDNFIARQNTTTQEPARSNSLVNFNNTLHSFVPSATSGYNHFRLNQRSDPSGLDNWRNLTRNMPTIIRDYDGNIFTEVDEEENILYVCHVSMGEGSVWGYASNKTSAGHVTVWRYGPDDVWTEIHRSVPGLHPRGLIPYSNLGPGAGVPSGTNPDIFKCSDYAILEYSLFDAMSRNVDVEIEYSIDEGLSWNTARQFRTYDTNILQGDGKTGLSSSPEGVTHQFYWHYVSDIGFNTEDNCLLRVRTRLAR